MRSNGSTTKPLSDVTDSGTEAAKEMITALMMRRRVHVAVNKQHLIQVSGAAQCLIEALK